MQRRNVLLPEPDGPTTHITSPLSIASEMPASAVNLPKRLTTSAATTILLMRGRSCARLPRVLVRGVAALTAREMPFEKVLADGEYRHDDEIPDRGDDQELHD